ncbi:secretin N-terminal domain-containing protein [Zoogloea sp.]|uniref:secretin N-terminal domain-containing protein n=1 Tax=Zoogloea sp. TaxID=49181 RepID=UPI0035B4E030
MTTPILRRLSAALCLLLLCCACTSNRALEESRQAFAGGNPESALRDLRERVGAEPKNLELRAYYLRQRDILTVRQLAMAEQARVAGRFDEAEQALALARQFDPNHPRVLAGAEAIAAARQRHGQALEAEQYFARGDLAGAEARARAVLAQDPAHAGARSLLRRLDERAATRDNTPAALQGPLARPVSLEFRDAPLRGVFEALSRASGLNFVFDRDVRADAKVTIFVRNNSIDDVLKLLMVTQQLERKLLNGNSVLIYPNTPAKQKDYQEFVTRSFYLANASVAQAQVLVKQMVKSRDVFVDEKLNLLIVKDTPEAVRLVEKLLASLDLAEPEVMLEVEVMEISRNKLLELGLRFPDQIGYGLLQPNTTSAVTTTTGTTITQNLGGQLLPGNVSLRNTGALVPYVANPALLLNLHDQDGSSNILANPRIRVRNRDKAKIHIGEKLPVFTTTSTANVGVSASVNYLDVGLKLEVEPSVHLDDEVAIKVSLEVSSIVKEVMGPSSSLAYQVGTRSAITSLRLRDGETQVLAGLISDEERTSANRLPGLGEMPAVGRLFSSQRDSESKTEIVLLITPRVVRNIVRPDPATATLAAGTESVVGGAPLQLGPQASAGMSFSPVGAIPAAPAVVMPASVPSTAPAVDSPFSLRVPEEVGGGDEFTVSVQLPLDGLESGTVVLRYDPALLVPADDPGATGGTRTLSLQLGSPNRGGARFRVRQGAFGGAVFELASSSLRVGGAERQLALPAPAVVRVHP